MAFGQAELEHLVTADDIFDNIDDSRSLVDACEAALGLLPPFAPVRRAADFFE